MTPIDNKKDIHLLPEGTREVTFAKDQPPYRPLPALVTPDGIVISTWKLEPGELALLSAGAPLTLSVWHGRFASLCECGRGCSHLLHPVKLEVGGTDARG